MGGAWRGVELTWSCTQIEQRSTSGQKIILPVELDELECSSGTVPDWHAAFAITFLGLHKICLLNMLACICMGCQILSGTHPCSFAKW